MLCASGCCAPQLSARAARRISRRSAACPVQATQGPKRAPSSASQLRRAQGLADYAQLKATLLRNTGLIGGGVAGYLLLSQGDLAVAGSVALGGGASVAYLALLCRHVDGLGPGVRGLPLERAPGENLGALALGAFSRVGDVYWNALAHPQLLVPVALAAGCTAWNGAQPPQLHFQYVYVLLGFLAYKVAVLDQGYKALKQVTLYAEPAPERPVLPDLPDIDSQI